MNIAVRYYSRAGKTKKVADAIAGAVDVEARDCGAPITEQTDLLFLGGAVYGGELNQTLREYIERLDLALVKHVAVFGTSAIVKTPGEETEKLLKERGIPVLEQAFYCRGSFAVLHMGHPNAEDLKRAAEFAVAAKVSLE